MNDTQSAGRIYLNYIMVLLPLIIYGFYKNGIVVYGRNLISLWECLAIILIPIVSFGIALIIDYLFVRLNKNFSRNFFLPLYALILCATLPPSINFFIFIPILILVLIIIKLSEMIKSIKFNQIALARILIFAFVILLTRVTYLNLFEKNIPQALEFTDMFFGRGHGGIFTTNIFFIIIAYIVLSRTLLYKKEIPMYMIGVFSILTLSFGLIFGNSETVWSDIFNNMVFFSAIFIAPEMISSPYTKKGKIYYGLILGVLTFLAVNFISVYEGVFIAIFIASFSVKYLDNLFALK